MTICTFKTVTIDTLLTLIGYWPFERSLRVVGRRMEGLRLTLARLLYRRRVRFIGVAF